MSVAINTPSPNPVQIVMNVSRMWSLFLLASRVLAWFGIRPTPCVVAWVAGHCVQASVGGRWHRVITPADEVIASCVQAP
jgi:hypothetical protein